MPCFINIFGMRSNAQTSSETTSPVLHWLKRAQRYIYQLKARPRLQKTCAFPSIPYLALVQTCSTLHIPTQSATKIPADLRAAINPLSCSGSNVLDAPHTNSKRHRGWRNPAGSLVKPESKYHLKVLPVVVKIASDGVCQIQNSQTGSSAGRANRSLEESTALCPARAP